MNTIHRAFGGMGPHDQEEGPLEPVSKVGRALFQPFSAAKPPAPPRKTLWVFHRRAGRFSLENGKE